MSPRWTRTYGPREDPAVRLLCFHYAGGTASMFRTWPAALPSWLEPVAVQLPGRDDRYAEEPYGRVEPLVADLVEALEPLLDRPFAFFGFSMGARVALELAHALRDRGLPVPARLFVAGSSAPALRLPVRGWDESDEDLVAYLRELGGTSAVVFDDPDLLALLLPTVRADLAVVGRLVPPDRPPLDVPIRAFAGADDTIAAAVSMRPWRAETAAAFDLTVVDGGHFFSPDGLAVVLRTTASDLHPVSAPGQ